MKVDDNDLSLAIYSPASPYVFGLLAHGTQNEVTLYYVPLEQLKSSTISWKKLFDVDAAVTNFSAYKENIYFVTHKNKPRYQVTRTSLKDPDVAHAAVVVPASEVVIQEADVAADGIYIRDLDGGIGRLRRLSFEGKVESIPAENSQSVAETSTTPIEPGALVPVVSWTTSPRWLKYDPKSKTASDTGIQPPVPVDTSNYEAEEVKARSADGTMIPLSVIHQKNLALDGKHATHLIGLAPMAFPTMPISIRCGWRGSSGAASSRLRTCAAAENTARSGTAQATSSPSNTPSMTSLPARSI